MISKVTPRTRNSETDSRFVAPDQYTDAVNIRVGQSFSESGTGDASPSSNVGVVKPVKGTTEFETTFDSTVVGKVVDSESGDVYVAAINPDANNNGVYRLTKSGQVEAIVKSSYFTWNDQSRVDMTVTYKPTPSGTSPIIYLTDNVSDPYKVDVSFHENNTELSGRRLFDAITVCTPTPQDVVQTTFGFQEGGSLSRTSNFRNIPGMQFAYQNIHETGEVSPLSAYSPIAVPPGYLTQGASPVESVDNYNSLQINIPAQPGSVEKVRLLVRFGEEGSWFVMGEYDNNGSDVTTYFQNDEILPALPSQQAERQFENVPQVAATNEVVEDRLFYGNYVEGYDNHPVTAALGVAYRDRPADFVALDIEVDSYVMGLERDGNTTGADNRVAGIRLKLQNPDEILIPADSTVSFDISFAPDKNFHIYEAQNSFHPNNELFSYNDNSLNAGNFNQDIFTDSSNSGASEEAWERAVYGYGPTTVAVGNSSGQRIGVSDDIITGEGARWRVMTGPNEGEELDVVYGSSPANPLIFKGGDVSFACRFRTTTDLTGSSILTLIKQVMDNDPTPMIIDTGLDDVSYVPVAELLSSQSTSSYSYNLGITNRQVVPRTSPITDMICHVGRKEVIQSNPANGSAPSGLNPVGYFIVDSATLDFKLRDITELPLSGASANLSEEIYFALDIKEVSDYSLKTVVPVFKTNGSSAVNAPLGGADLDNLPGGLYQYDDTNGQVASVTNNLFPLAENGTIQKWVAFDPLSVGQTLTQTAAAELFSNLDGSTSGPSYRQITNFSSLSDADANLITSNIQKSGGGTKTRAWNNMCWFGRLLPANTSVETVIAAIGGTAGGATTTEVLGDLYIPYDVALQRADLDVNVFTGQLRNPFLFSNYAASMIDGEGGIGGWKGSLTDTALVWADYVWDKNADPEWEALTESPFTETSIRNAMGGYGGKISGSVPASVILYGKLMTEVRVLGDDRGGDANSNSGRYPENVPAYGPALLGFNFPFQYLYTGGADTSNGVEIVINRYLGTTTTALEGIDSDIVATYSLLRVDPGDSYSTGAVPGYLKINPDDGEYDEQPSSLEILSDNTFILSAQDDVEGFKSFKRNSTHDFGIVYYDKFGRSGNVNPLPSIYVGGYSQADQGGSAYGAGNVHIAVNISSDPPSWAHGYRFVYGGNSSINDFIQYTAGGAFVPVNDEVEEGDEGNIYVSLNYLQENSDVSYSKAFGAVSSIGDKQMYKYKEGDKLRIISYFQSDSIDSRIFPYNYIFDVVDVVTLTNDASNPLHDNSDGDVPNYKTGQFVVLRNNTNASNFSYASVRSGNNEASTTNHFWNNRAVFEIYSPTSKKDAEERVYREIGKYYKCVEISGVLKHENTVHMLTDGDVWFRRIAMNIPKFKNNRFVNIIRGENSSTPRFLDYYVESNRFSDTFVGTDVIGKGKAKLYLPDSKRVRRSSSITFSDANNPNSQYNKFSTFDATTANFKNIPNEHGPIELMKRDGDSVTVFQKNKVSFIPINRSVISDASNSASLIASSKVVGTQVFVPGRYGSGGNPEAVLYVDGMFYFANRHRREVYRYVPGSGIEVISDLGMKEYFNNLFENTDSTTRIVTAIDHLNDEFLISVSPYTSVTYTTAPVQITQDTATSQGTDSGTGGVTFVDPTTVVDSGTYDELIATNEGLQLEIDELEGLVASLQDQLDQAFNDVNTVVVSVTEDPPPGGAEDDGVTVTPGEDPDLPDPLEITQEYVVAVEALIRAQEQFHSTVKTRYDLTVGLNNDLIYNANNLGPDGLWDRLGIDPPTDAQLISLNQTLHGDPANPKNAFSGSLSSLNLIDTAPYNPNEETINFPTALNTGEVGNTLSGFGLTYVVGWGAGLSSAAVSDLIDAQNVSGVDPTVNIINEFFPSPLEGSWVATFNDPNLSGLTQIIGNYIRTRSNYINVINEYVAEQFELVTEALTEKDVTITELSTELANIKDQYFNDIAALSEVFHRIPNPGKPDENVVWVAGGSSDTFVKNAKDYANYDAMQLQRDGFESIDFDSVATSLGNALNDRFDDEFNTTLGTITSLQEQRNALADQVGQLILGYGQAFQEQSDLSGDGSVFTYSDPTIQQIYTSVQAGGSSGDIISILSTNIADNILDTADVVGASSVSATTSGAILDAITATLSDEASATRFVDGGLADAIETLTNAISSITDEVAGTEVGSVFGPIGTQQNDTSSFWSQQFNNDQIANTLTSLAEVLNAEAQYNGKTSVRGRLAMLEALTADVVDTLVGNVADRNPNLNEALETRAVITPTVPTTDPGFMAPIEDWGLNTTPQLLDAYMGLVRANGTQAVLDSAGPASYANEKAFYSVVADSVRRSTRKLTDFQKALGQLTTPYAEGGSSTARLGDLGVSALNFTGQQALSSTFLRTNDQALSSLYSLQLFIAAVANQLQAVTGSVEFTDADGVTSTASDRGYIDPETGSSYIAPLFTSIVQTAILSEVTDETTTGGGDPVFPPVDVPGG